MRRTLVFGIMACIASSAALAQTPSPGCSAAESRQFDFWVGKWDVAQAKAPGKTVANSLIEKLYIGCAVRENWMPLKTNEGGGSLNAYDSVQHKWRQFWVDSDGAITEFVGGWTGKTMILEGPENRPGKAPQTKRMTFTPKPDGSVEQLGEITADGKSWKTEYDLIYTRAK